MDTVVFTVFRLIVLIFSVMVHEIAHGAVALSLGDTTAKDAGRLTLNPLKHIDPFGSVILPILLLLLPGAPVIGWAKPVPYNPFRLKDPRRGSALIGAAGPLSNFALAVIFAVLLRVGVPFIPDPTGTVLALLFQLIILTNVALAVFNLLPLPPLDGSGIVLALLPRQARSFSLLYARYGIFLLMAFVMFGASFIGPVIEFIFRILVGNG